MISCRLDMCSMIESESVSFCFMKKRTEDQRSAISWSESRKIVMAVALQEFLDSLGAKSLG